MKSKHVARYVSMEWLMRKRKSLLSQWERRKYALNFSCPSGGIKKFIPSTRKIVSHMDTHAYTDIITRYMAAAGEREARIRFTCLATMGHGALIYGLCVVFRHSIINDCVPISHFPFPTILSKLVMWRPFHFPIPLLDPHHKMFFLLPLQIRVYPIFQFESDVWMVQRMEKSYTIFHLIWLGRKVVNLFPASLEHNKSVTIA